MADRVETAGLRECSPPEGMWCAAEVETTEAAAQTEAVLMREEFTSITRETRDDPSGMQVYRETETVGLREPGDILWRTWHRDSLGPDQN